MAELVDAPDSKSGSREGVRVRPPSPGTISFIMETTIRRGLESDLPALRDILNYYILKTVGNL